MKRTKKPPEIGDYVLATKYADGDPRDHFAVGYLQGTVMEGTRYIVVDNSGAPFRANGFRRCERISPRVGNAIVAAAKFIGDKPGHSVWHWRRRVKQLERIAASFGPSVSGDVR